MELKRHTKEELSVIAQRAHALYEERIRDQVEPDHVGKFLVLDIKSGDYELDRDPVMARKRLHARRPDPETFLMRVGYSAAYSFAGYGLPRTK